MKPFTVYYWLSWSGNGWLTISAEDEDAAKAELLRLHPDARRVVVRPFPDMRRGDAPSR